MCLSLGRVKPLTLVTSQAPVYTNPLDLAAPFSLMSLFKAN